MPKQKLSSFENNLEIMNRNFCFLKDMKTRKDSLNYYFTAKNIKPNIYECILSTRTDNNDPNFKQLYRVNIYTYKFTNIQYNALIFYGETNDYETNGWIYGTYKNTQTILTNLFMCGMEVTNILKYELNTYSNEINFKVKVKDNSDTTIFNKCFGSTVGASM